MDPLRFKKHPDLATAQTEVIRQVNRHKQWLEKLVIKPGQKVWELNLDTFKVSEAKIDEEAIQIRTPRVGPFDVKPRYQASRKIFVRPECIYCVALNRKNAEKKFKLMLLNWIK